MMASLLGTTSRSRDSVADVHLVGAMGYGSLVAPDVIRAGASGAIAVCIKSLAAAIGENA